MGLARISLLKATKLHSLSHEGSSSSTEKKDIKGPTAKQPNTNYSQFRKQHQHGNRGQRLKTPTQARLLSKN